MHVWKKLCSLATVSNCPKFTTVLLSSHSPRPISSDLLKLSPKCSTERKIITGVNPFNSYSPHLPLKRQYLSSGDEAPCIFGHPPQSYFSSALMSLPPAASSPVCIHRYPTFFSYIPQKECFRFVFSLLPQGMI